MSRRKVKRTDKEFLRPRGRATTHGMLTRVDKFLGQFTIDCLGDTTQLPLTRLKRRDPAELFASYHAAHPFFRQQFDDAPAFRGFVARANSEPIAIIRAISEKHEEWRPILNRLYADIFVTRPTRTDPIIRLLRDHWSWKWTEMLAIYDKLIRANPDDLSIGFYDAFTPNLWLCSISSNDDAQDNILLGPIKNKAHATQNLSHEFAIFVTKSLDTIRADKLPPIHVISRYEQFYHERPPIYPRDIRRQRDALAVLWKLMNNVIWPTDHAIDYYDVTAIVEFSFLVSEFHGAPKAATLVSGKDTLISYHYPAISRSESSRARQLSYRISTDGAVTSERIIFRVVPPPLTEDPIICSITEREFSEYINNKFEDLSRRRLGSQAQRLYEELLILRNLLADSFGNLTAPGATLHGAAPDGDGNRLGKQITRMAAEACNAQSAVLYKYDHRQNILFAVGAYTEDPQPTSIWRENYKWMEDAGRNLEQRQRSVAYAAADRLQSVEYNEGNEFVPLSRRHTTMTWPPTGSPRVAGSTAIAVPVKVLGRLWGVFEVIGSTTNSFSHVHVELISKVGDLVGPYYHEHFIFNLLYHQVAASSVEGEGHAAKAFDELAERVADIFLTESACIWVRDLLDWDEFRLLGFTGRADLAQLRAEGKGSPTVLARGQGGSIALDVIQKKAVWASGEIGIPQFSEAWLDKMYTKQLPSLGYRYIALIPVNDLENRPIALLSIYSKGSPFLSNWESWTQYVSHYVGAVVSRIYNAREIESQGRRLIAHEVQNAVKIAQVGADKLKAFIGRLPDGTKHRNASLWISDIHTHLADIEAGVAEWARGGSDDNPRKRSTVLLATALERARNRAAPEVVFRYELNTCIQSLRREIRNKGLELNIQYPKRTLGLQIHPENLRMILNNLISNAVKYSPQRSTIHCGFEEKAYSVLFFMRNLGLPPMKGEPLRIFELGFRGQNARQAKEGGSGLGLYVVKRLCDFYGIGVSYQSMPTDDKREKVWHQFNLDFPHDMTKA
jgi:Histidine kinase-, DNA gyrase B-, and HSP90-like ATPase